MKYCPNCGKSGVAGMKFCPSCGTKLIQESVSTSDIQSDVKPSIEPRVNQGLQQRPRSVALKWGTGILFALTVLHLISMISLIELIRLGFEPYVFGDFILFPLALAAAIYTLKRKHWRYVLGVTIWLLVADIIGLIMISASWQIALVGLGDVVWALFLFLLEITCIILISRTKAEFS